MKIGTDLEHAAHLLKQGELVAMPTETVYGLAANALESTAVKKIYAAKGRPSHNPLITHIFDMQQAEKFAVFNDDAYVLTKTFWPGPLTLVLPRTQDCPLALEVSAGHETVALRMPAHPLARALLNKCKLPLAAPSANRSGHVTSTKAQHVADDFAHTKLYILEAGSTEIGLESTVVKCDEMGITLLRPGSITVDMLENAIGKKMGVHLHDDAAPQSPGMLTSHYAPNAKLRLNATEVLPGEALLAFGSPLAHSGAMLNLSETSNLQEASEHLFDYLRELDKSGATHIAIMPIPTEGIGLAINDRLSRAAVPKQP